MSSGTVTFQPGVGTNTFPVYDNFGPLSAYITTQPGINDWTILVDGSSSGGSPSIQTGPWPLPPSVRFSALANSSFASGYPTLSGDDVSFSGASAVSFINFPYIQINNTAQPSLFTVGAGQTLNVEVINTYFLGGFKAYFAAVSGGSINVFLHEFSILDSTGDGSFVLSVDGSSNVSSASISLFDASGLATGAATVDTGGSLSIYMVDSTHVDSSYFTAAGVSVTLLSMAPEVLYTPTTPADWSPPPADVAAALDQLAGRSSGSGGGTSPELATQLSQLSAQVADLTSQVAILTAQFQEQQKINTLIFALLKTKADRKHHRSSK